MAAFNKVILIGNLTADPELKQTTQGTPVTSFTIAVSRRNFSKSADSTPQTDFFNVVAWRSLAEFVTKYFQKGRSILICGSLQTRNWTDQNGQKHYITEVVAEEASFVDKKPDGAAASNNASPAPYSANPKDIAFEEMTTDDDLPF